MSDIQLPYRPRADEDPAAAGVVQANLDYLVSLFTKGENDGDIPMWDSVLGKFVAVPMPSGLPPGAGCLWFSTAAPTDWAILDGSTLTSAQTNYPTLWANVDSTFKSGSNIILPDLRGRIPVGKGSHVDVDTLGESDGAALADRRPAHKHTVNDTGHQHMWGHLVGAGNSIGGSVQNAYNGTFDTVALNSLTTSVTTGVTVGPQTAGTPTDEPSYIVVNFIIKLQ